MSTAARQILDGFAEMVDNTDYFPGSIHPIVRHPNRSEPDRRRMETEGWDSKPKTLRVGGEDRHFFTIGQLAQALGRKPVTLRKWEREGWIPKPTFEKRVDDPRARRRLYSREQVEGLVRIANEEGLMDFGAKARAVTHTDFPRRALELWKELAK